MNRRQPPKQILLAAVATREGFMRGVVRCAKKRNWELVTDMLYTGTYPRGWRGDGILALPSYQPDLAEYLRRSAVPSVVVAMTDEAIPAARVEPDNVAIGRLAARHLMELPVRSFAWAPFLNDRVNRERLAGFDAELRNHDRACQILPPMHRRVAQYWHDDWTTRRAQLTRHLLELPRPAAIFAANDGVASDLLDACGEANLRVPEDVAILGVGNDQLICESRTVGLSSIDDDPEEMACQAADLLGRLLEGEGSAAEMRRVRPRGIIQRASTHRADGDDLRIFEAQAYVADNYTDPLFGVSAVADAVRLSRRQLERSFRQVTGCTVRGFIERSRMNEAARLLREHPQTRISTVAELVGLRGASHFVRTFRRHFGTTPTAYRIACDNEVGVSARGPCRDAQQCERSGAAVRPLLPVAVH